MVCEFSQVRVIEGQFVPREPKLVRVIGSFEKSGVKLYSLSEANPRETRFGSRYREVRETEGSRRNRDSTVVVKTNRNVVHRGLYSSRQRLRVITLFPNIICELCLHVERVRKSF